MWSIFNNEDLSLNLEKKNEKRKTFEKIRNKNLLNKRSYGSFSHYDSKNFNKTIDDKIRTLKKHFRKNYRIIRTNLLKLIKIIKKFPEANNEKDKPENESISIDIELIKKLNKIINKIDIEQLKSKKRIRKNRFKNTHALHSNLSKRSFPSKIFSIQKNDSFKNNINVIKKKYSKRNLLLNTTNNIRNIHKQNSYENGGLLYCNNLKNNYYYMNLKNKKQKNSNFYNDTNDVSVTDFYIYSTLNASFNRLNSMNKKKKKLNLLNIQGNNIYLKKENTLTDYNNIENSLKNRSLQNVPYMKNYNILSSPYLHNLTEHFYSPKKKQQKKNIYSNKQKLKKFVKDEKIRSLLRTATNEDELLKAINVAKIAGLDFEAKLGNKKLQKLKSIS
ncbi:conserved Plasmodium protein, unknown function [Plasmodium gallinaceum]|uniref:Uncharacterized protein n=1 Tax=Plasmodium gallinaceum TaxID=5849 RepID=A0A1J1GMK5_PLAGA|nr:conserved Plasmodium protein, unknown function [Plasmodium gallinaceum]CRG93485.1 conserved Plasmodium protein, unknown function [Plasmodium gallinaceum]